jgi:hypothetical protein
MIIIIIIKGSTGRSRKIIDFFPCKVNHYTLIMMIKIMEGSRSKT